MMAMFVRTNADEHTILETLGLCATEVSAQPVKRDNDQICSFVFYYILKLSPYSYILLSRTPSYALIILKKTKLRGRSPQANYTDRATAACRRS
jgi:hypothetical protein